MQIEGYPKVLLRRGEIQNAQNPEEEKRLRANGFTPPYVYAEFPLMLYRGTATLVVNSHAERESAEAEGWAREHNFTANNPASIPAESPAAMRQRIAELEEKLRAAGVDSETAREEDETNDQNQPRARRGKRG